MNNKEYGGFIEFEKYIGSEYHDDAIGLNCGRNALAFLIERRNIKKIYLPYFICSSVITVCEKYGVLINFYSIDINFHPLFQEKIKTDEWFYLVNYYGQISNEEIVQYKEKLKNLIVDNAQSYFQLPVDRIDTIYTCRKFFGVADGAFVYASGSSVGNIDKDFSFDRMNFLMGRFEKGANDFYQDYISNNHSFGCTPILKMSELTHNLLRSIDYNSVKKIREANFTVLHKRLVDVNKLKLIVPDGAFMYPLYLENGSRIRKILQKKRIYIPILWPDIFSICSAKSLEYDMADNILPIPVDQRYGENDMLYLADEIMNAYNWK